MANIFRNSITGSVGIVETSVYTTPALTTATLIGLNVANVSNETIEVDVALFDTSKSVANYLTKGLVLPKGTSAVIVGGDQKVVLEESDEVRVRSNVDTSTDVIASILEMS
jgi:hypothetical protein